MPVSSSSRFRFVRRAVFTADLACRIFWKTSARFSLFLMLLGLMFVRR